MSRPYVPTRDGRFDNTGEAIDFIERTNCAKGCSEPGEEANARGLGPGGSCPILARVAIGDGEPITALADGGSWIRCEERTPRWEEDEGDDRPQVETLF